MISKWTLYKRIYKKFIIIVLNNTGSKISSGRKKSKKKEQNKENKEKKKNAASERKKTRRLLNKIFTQSTDGCCEKLMLGVNGAAEMEFIGDGNWKARAMGTYTKMEGGKYRKDSSDFHEQMYKWSDGTWRVGMHENHDPGWVKSVGPSSCPEDITHYNGQWQFFDRSEGGPFNYVKGDITVICCSEVDARCS